MYTWGRIILFLLGGMLLFSCGSRKKVVYLQDVEVNKRIKAECEYKTVIHTDDLLSIIVSCDDLESALPFNTPMIGLGREVNTTTTQQIPRGYLVDKNGEIDFPVLGKIKVEGISRNDLAELLKEKLSVYLKNPIVTIQFQNFKVTILGEVKNPGSYKVASERVSILDALGMAGDLGINGKRKNVLVMREQGDEKIFTRVDLTSSEFIDSPFFYLQQNDVVYVEPNKGRIAGGSVSAFLPYILSSMSTIVALITLIVK
ncbi:MULTISPECIES: polysaccharide biosynthesis/export family protein [Butyricimonas]|uniref:polysaccharide biosynthesis/export family protein n=1 Tax=Butyricimonas TaxID=574697 RepID=UPI001D094502|nr:MULTISPECIES: polysaccharide biosynthesis/export family protein [Butyricimonas]MCB6974223.1 polysaccharide biosynthesis/export family protein [Butyricimonas synergistica]MCG4520980.1 polysaccharide biosynthesis/export family protein [Butyricimonas sp. DFI.6.44]